jgi:flagellar hook-basal body complex protein FliE
LNDISGVGGTGDLGTSFADALEAAVEDANGKALEAEHQVQRLAAGDGSIHQAMIAMQDASIAMDMVLAVRNKALEAYQEVMRMPV